ncbi:MAG: hypothetical protein ACMUJM_26190 [bacterium]
MPNGTPSVKGLIVFLLRPTRLSSPATVKAPYAGLMKPGTKVKVGLIWEGKTMELTVKRGSLYIALGR